MHNRTLSFLVRRAVLLALAPVPLACGSNVVTGGAGGQATTTSTTTSSGPSTGPTTTASSSSTTTTTSSSGGPCSPYWLSGNATNGGEVLFPCGYPPAIPTTKPTNQQCARYCMQSINFNICTVESDGGYSGEAFEDTGGETGPITVNCFNAVTGRRPAGLIACDADARVRSVGEMLAIEAHLEAAAVVAFKDLAVQLDAHGAPHALVERLLRAADQEVRHAREVGALARARGAEPQPVQTQETGIRSLLDLALENAREGCVRETWGAACAVAQAESAADADVRDVMQRIAADELTHATLSWDMAAWLDARLCDAERAQVAAERERALRELALETEAPVPSGWACALGLPSPAQSRAILAAMARDVWSHDGAGMC
jgi:rubrerythrin